MVQVLILLNSLQFFIMDVNIIFSEHTGSSFSAVSLETFHFSQLSVRWDLQVDFRAHHFNVSSISRVSNLDPRGSALFWEVGSGFGFAFKSKLRSFRSTKLSRGGPWTLKMEAWRLKIEAWRLKMEAWRLNIEARRLKMEPRRLKIEAWRLKMEACRLKMEAWRLKMEAWRVCRPSGRGLASP